jgi:dTDP-4-amino-4,6-dideoxygalactose transaminase
MNKYNPFEIVKTFEKTMAEYTGAKYAVAVDSCTNAVFLCCKYLKVEKATIPSKTYLSVPMSIIHAGAEVVFDASNEANDWSGIYQLKPYPIYDSAKRLTTDMYIKGSFMCLSFHQKKHICIGKGGMILTDDKKAVEWFKRARYEGRSEKFYRDDTIDMLGWNMYMTPEQASRGLALFQNYPIHNEDQIEKGGYRDLREFSVFKDVEVIGARKKR